MHYFPALRAKLEGLYYSFSSRSFVSMCCAREMHIDYLYFKTKTKKSLRAACSSIARPVFGKRGKDWPEQNQINEKVCTKPALRPKILNWLLFTVRRHNGCTVPGTYNTPVTKCQVSSLQGVTFNIYALENLCSCPSCLLCFILMFIYCCSYKQPLVS